LELKAVSLVLVFGACLLYTFPSYSILYAQVQQTQLPQKPILGIKITFPTAGQEVPVGEMNITGISTDNATSDCTVYADLNNVKPFQKAIAAGLGGVNDYSTWDYTYTDKYHLITNGTNNLTSKLSCLNNNGGTANLTTYYSVNVTGLTSDRNQQHPLSITGNSTTLGNSTNLGNGTATTTAALAVGAENVDSRNILPRPIVVEEKQSLPIIDNSTTLGNGTSAVTVFPSHSNAEPPIIPEQPTQVESHEGDIKDKNAGDKVKDVSSKDVSSKDVSSKDVSSKDVSSKDVSSKDVSSKDVSSKIKDKVKEISTKKDKNAGDKVKDVSSKDVSSKIKDKVKEISTKIKDKVKHVHDNIPFKLPFS
jgi:hypothetical protein